VKTLPLNRNILIVSAHRLYQLYFCKQKIKLIKMKTNAAQQEILLIKYSSFSQRQLLAKNTSEDSQKLDPDEQLEAACWNGWLNAMLPEIVDTSATGEKLYLWQIMQAKSLLNIELCESPQMQDIQYSINPYVILTAMCYE
jgi:hypothetical protein